MLLSDNFIYFYLGKTNNCLTADKSPEKIDEKYFETLFRQHFYALVSFANHFVFDGDASKDIVHNVFINLWENREHMHLDTSLKSW